MKAIVAIKPLASVLIVIVLTIVSTNSTAAGNDFVYGELRVDLSEVYWAEDYRVWLSATAKPNSGFPDFTTAWFGVELAPFNGQPFSAQFSQVGIITNSLGVRWFVYAEPGVNCLRGSSAWGNLGCQGNIGDLISLGPFHEVELVTYGQGYWIARVYNQYGTGYDVAQILSGSVRIYRAGSVTEEGYSTPQDPYLTASFYHWHPQYMFWGSFQDWPPSEDGHISYIHATDINGQNTFCPQHYGADPNQWNDERAWFAGTGGQQCWWGLFPPDHIYLPLVMKNSS
jgi:hypothetical protein